MISQRPFSPEELKNSYPLIKEGKYEFIIEKAEPKKTKNNEWMISLKLQIFVNDSKRIIFDNLLVDNEKTRNRYKGFMQCVGMENKLLQEHFNTHELVDKTGELFLTIHKDNTGQYPDKNAVKYYISRPGAHSANASPNKEEAAKLAEDFFKDDIKF